MVLWDNEQVEGEREIIGWIAIKGCMEIDDVDDEFDGVGMEGQMEAGGFEGERGVVGLRYICQLASSLYAQQIQ